MGRKNSEIHESSSSLSDRAQIAFGKNLPGAFAGKVLMALVLAAAGCTAHVKIEPSDKPFIVNLNVKIDHDIRVKIEDQNKDLINLEDQVLDKSKVTDKAKKTKS